MVDNVWTHRLALKHCVYLTLLLVSLSFGMYMNDERCYKQVIIVCFYDVL